LPTVSGACENQYDTPGSEPNRMMAPPLLPTGVSVAAVRPSAYLASVWTLAAPEIHGVGP
jgi:hypothetical protein